MGTPNSVITGAFFLNLSRPQSRVRAPARLLQRRFPTNRPNSPLVSLPVPLSRRLRRSRWRSGVRRKRGTGGETLAVAKVEGVLPLAVARARTRKLSGAAHCQKSHPYMHWG